ncbi:Nucleolar complex protein 2 homolog [Seminavis robusta]|uniref:Nucleolar complex protein 2 homolog n=1 Tax=Seminavis robusta TaxID=568900 RepID=A0A9N8E5N9_9STRA|nr:Nucleolar complex protein 2 homolog [Seminavis robusta]|eukprot:Sro541_g163210.1 Nucleolar complex protein 2 homolog (974) ;mRNA; r:38431-41473
MGKHKQTKRERKFAITGGVKGRLENGGTIVSKGKKKMKKRAEKTSKDLAAIEKKERRAQRNADEYKQQQKAQRDAEDFTGRDNLSGMDVNSFFATLEEELTNNKNQLSDYEDDDVMMSDDDSSEEDPKKEEESDNDEESSEEEEEEKPTKASKKKTELSSKAKSSKKEKEASSSSSSNSDEDSDSSSSSDDSSSDKKPPSNKKKASTSNKKTKKAASDGDDDSDSDDEDIDAAEARMKAEMKKLQSEDPDFHEFLKENEEELLDFGEEQEEDDNDDEDDAEDKKDDKEDDKGGDATSIELTPKMLRDLSRGAFQDHGIKSLKKLLRAYKSACKVATNAADDDQGGDDNNSNNKKKRRRQKNQEKSYRIESSKVFDSLMVTTLGRCHESFYYHLLATEEEKQQASQNKKTAKANKDNNKEASNKGKKGTKQKRTGEEDDGDDEERNPGENEEKEGGKEEDTVDVDETPLDPKVLERSDKWVDVKPLLSVFLRSTLHLISESKEPDLLAIVLKSLDKYIRYMTPFPRIAEALLRTLTGLWSAPMGDASADYQVVRLNAFLRIRQLALTQPFPFIETCLKKTYLAYARRAKFGGDSASVMSNTLPTLTFMGNCLVELYSLDHSSSYQHAFVYIRQLALLLRAYMQKKTKEAAQQVFCWQFIHCLKLWVAVLSTCCKQAREGTNDGKNADHLMRELVYPLTEIIMGVVRLMPAPTRYVPLRFHCVRLCQQLAAASEKFIPTTSLLMPILDLKEISAKPKKVKSRGATTRGVQLPFLLRLPKDDPLRTAEEQEAVMAELFKLLNRELDLYQYSPGFPEFQFNVNQRLKKFIKNTKNSRWRVYARGSVDLCERHMDFAIHARSDLSAAPKDVKTLECIRPQKESSMGDRYAAAVEKENKEWTSLIAPTLAKQQSSGALGRKNDAVEGGGNSDDNDEPKKKKAKRGKKAAQVPPPAVDDKVMDIEDTVEEGVVWSSDDDA